MSNDFKTTDMTRVLVFGGKTGWIGQMMVELLKKGTRCAIAGLMMSVAESLVIAYPSSWN